MDAFMNHGRWLAYCPDCGAANKVDRNTGEYLCLLCNQSLIAVAYTPKPNNPKLFVKVPDVEERQKALARAKRNKATFKYTPEKVERLLRKRNKANMNWFPHETLADLERENAEHGVK